MSMMRGLTDKMKRVKGAEWAMLLIVLGLAGSLLLSSGTSLFGGTGTGTGTGAQPSQSTSDALEARLSSVLSSMEGAGRVEVVIHYEKSVQASSTSWLDTSSSSPEADGEPVGVVVVAEGADDIWVRLELARAVQTLLRLDADAVEVFKMGGVGQEE